MKYKNLQKNRGFVILFAVTLAAILLSIALGVANIALKELNFTTSAKDTNNAFFAADTGAECALVNNKSTADIFVHPNPAPFFFCNGNSIITAQENPDSFWSFSIAGLGSETQGCSLVTVDKTNPSLTTIISKGYNNADGNSGTCVASPNAVERELKVTY